MLNYSKFHSLMNFQNSYTLTDSVDVVTVVSSAPHLRQSAGSTPEACATYWRPWD